MSGYHRPLYPLIVTIFYDAIMSWFLYKGIITTMMNEEVLASNDKTLLIVAAIIICVLMLIFTVKFLNYYREGLSRAEIRERRGLRAPTRDDEIHALKVQNLFLWILYLFK